MLEHRCKVLFELTMCSDVLKAPTEPPVLGSHVCMLLLESEPQPGPPPALLNRPLSRLTRWQTLSDGKYEITSSLSEAAILVKTTTEPKLTLKITLTSPAMRDEDDEEDEEEEVEEGEEEEQDEQQQEQQQQAKEQQQEEEKVVKEERVREEENKEECVRGRITVW